jgi:Hemerythrin HHE cation binding domain
MTLPATAPAQEVAPQGAALAIPPAMQAEHDAIHRRLARATAAPGRTGEAARALAKVLHPHFVREEQIALPPLGLLAPLARDEFTPEMPAVLPMVDSLRAELPRMLEEHKTIHAAAARLAEVARLESNAEVEDLAITLAAHAGAEEQLFYPAAVLVGEVVRSRAAAHDY